MPANKLKPPDVTDVWSDDYDYFPADAGKGPEECGGTVDPKTDEPASHARALRPHEEILIRDGMRRRYRRWRRERWVFGAGNPYFWRWREPVYVHRDAVDAFLALLNG